MQPTPVTNDALPPAHERTQFDFQVAGRLPVQLNGTFARLGAAAGADAEATMIHALAVRDGRPERYKSRTIWTRDAAAAAPRGTLPPRIDGPRAHGLDGPTPSCLLPLGARLLALREYAPPLELSPSLDGARPLAQLTGPNRGLAAHPCFEPVSGCVHALACELEPPGLHYVVLDGRGEVLHQTRLAGATPPMVHGCCITQTRLVLFDHPVGLSMEAAISGREMPLQWQHGRPLRVGILPLGGEGHRIQWLTTEPCCVLHTVNAYDVGEGIVIDLVRHDDRAGAEGVRAPPRLQRWHLDPHGDRVFQETLMSDAVEFPTFDGRWTGRQHGIMFAVSVNPEAPGALGNALHRVDLGADRVDSYAFEADEVLGECVFVPWSSGAPEGRGWLLGHLHGPRGEALVVFEASAVGRGPVARVELEGRSQPGGHGCWIAAP